MRKVKLQIELPESFVSDIMVAALEGGINYWCEKATVKDGDFKGKSYASDVLEAGGTLILHPEDDEPVELDLEKFLTGLEKLCGHEHRGGHFVNVALTGDHDAEDADCIVQYAVFGELVYS